MDEYQAYIPFSADKDWNGLVEGEDGEFYYRNKNVKKKKSKKRTKEEAYLGIWADDSSSDNEGDGFGGVRTTFTKPVAFVSRETLNPENVAAPQYEPPPKKHQPLQQKSATPKNYVDMGSKTPLESWDLGGKASKMMRAMGYTGGGLGKDGTGIAEAIEVQVRPDKACLSYRNRDERTAQSRRDFEDYEITGKLGSHDKVKAIQGPEDQTGTMPSESRWRKGQQRPKKPVYEFVSQKPAAQQKIVDMRGPHTKVLDSYDGAVIPQNLKAPYLPELYHNLQILCDMKESAIHQNQTGTNYQTNLKVQLQKEKASFEIQISSEVKQIARLEELLAVVEHAQQKMQAFHKDSDPLSLEFMKVTFEELQTHYLAEWHQFELIGLAYHIVFPLMTKLFANWDPLESPLAHLTTITTWRPLLDPDITKMGKLQKATWKEQETSSPLQALANMDRLISEYGQTHNQQNCYLKMFDDAVFPKFRQTLMNEWKPQEDWMRAKRLITTWAQVTPPPTLKMIIEQLIYSKLRSEVDHWNPRAATILVSDWLHPWANVLSPDLMKSLLQPVLAKLGQALLQWDPKDSTAYIMIAPWKEVLTAQELEAFLQSAILPKLYTAFQKFEVLPNAQDMTIWQSVLKWKDLFQDQTLTILLVNEFFPKWLNALFVWLSGEKPNFQEVSKWYMDWKAQMPANIAQDPLVIQRFNQALEMMQSSMSGHLRPPPKFVRLEHFRLGLQ